MYDLEVIVEAIAELVKFVAPIVSIFAIVGFSLRTLYQAFNGGKIR